MKLNKDESILAVGDSLTYGFGAKEDESYPTVLSRISGYKVENFGLNGETSQEGLSRLPNILEKSDASLVILCFGGNDILQKLPMSELKSNLKKMVKLIKSYNKQVVLISVPNLTLFGLSPLELYEEVADEENVVLISHVLSTILIDRSLKSDQIHPNNLGYKKMAEMIYEKLLEEEFLTP